jgi:predicted site-specific integrase-resolvase
MVIEKIIIPDEVQENSMLNVEEVASCLGIDMDTVERWTALGLIQFSCTSCGGGRMYRYEDITGFMDRKVDHGLGK